jgi:hypothetical protein
MNLVKKVFLMALFFATFVLGGCSIPKPGILTFDKHNIDLECFDASDMRISYGNYKSHGLYLREYNHNHERKIARAKQTTDDTKFLSGTMGYYRAFEGPLYVQWHALDDSVINATIDLYKIFPDKVIPNNEDPKQIDWSLPTSGLPVIVIEVNNRTLNIYSDVTILFEHPDHKPGHRISKRNRILVFSKTY